MPQPCGCSPIDSSCAVCDQVAHRAHQVATEFGAAAVDGFRALAQREDVDAILILSPQWYGALPVLAACEAGKAVYCASGIDLNVAEAAQIKERVEEAGIAFMAEFPRRFAPATLRLKELIATRLGNPRLLFCHQRSVADLPGNQTACRWPRPSGSRYLVELVDWCRYVVDREATWVSGVMHPGTGKPGEEDYQMMSLDFSDTESPGSGTIAQISCGRYIPANWQEAITFRPLPALQVSCERGIAFIDLPATLVWFDEAGRHQDTGERAAGRRAAFYAVPSGGHQPGPQKQRSRRCLQSPHDCRTSAAIAAGGPANCTSIANCSDLA